MASITLMNGHRRELVIVLATIVVILASIYAVPVLHSLATRQGNIKTATPQIVIPASARVKVQVYRAGHLVEEQEMDSDPLLYNFWALIANTVLGRGYSDPLTIYKTDGTTFTRPEWESIGTSSGNYNNKLPMLAIGFGPGVTSPSFYDYEITSLLARVDVPSTSYTLTDNGTAITITASASWTADQNTTVGDVGLYWKGYQYRSASSIYVLIARDALSSPIPVVTNDVVVATYTISISYSKKPILKNFVALIVDYILGAKAYGHTINYIDTTGTARNAWDFGSDYTWGNDYENEKTYIGVTSAVTPYSPGLAVVESAGKTSSNVKVELGNNGTHVWFSVYAAPVVFSTKTTVRAFYLELDNLDYRYEYNAYSSCNVLLMYFPLDSPITVPAGSGIKATFTIYFRWN